MGLLSRLEELQNLVDKLIVVLEDAAVSGIGIEGELGIWQPSSQVDGVAARHHPIVVTVCDEDRLLNACQVGRFLPSPGVDGLELRAERYGGNRLIAIVRAFLQPLQELSSR